VVRDGNFTKVVQVAVLVVVVVVVSGGTCEESSTADEAGDPG
jgi:hypothetical protein